MGACGPPGGMVARKGRARRFREARELKQGFDDGLFGDGERTLADVVDADDDDAPTWDDEEPTASAWDDEDDPLHDPRDEPRGA